MSQDEVYATLAELDQELQILQEELTRLLREVRRRREPQ